MILDIGPDTSARYAELIRAAGTVIWNGPVGVFEFDAFANGTQTLARAIRSEEHTSELQSLMRISYAVFCLKKKKTQYTQYTHQQNTKSTQIRTKKSNI